MTEETLSRKPSAGAAAAEPPAKNNREQLYVASQWRLMWLKFRRHKLAVISSVVLVLFYLDALLSQFVAPYDIQKRDQGYVLSPPMAIRFVDRGRFQLRPFVYGYKQTINLQEMRREYVIDPSKKYDLRLFVEGDPYKLFGLLRARVHLFGAQSPGVVYLFGTDDLGRDMFSRIVVASQISLSIGLVGVFLTFILGSLLGGVSGFYGGWVDTLIQRIIELLRSIPTIPLWMGLSAALPANWSSVKVYFGITLILSLIGWTTLARVVRGQLLQLREEDFVMAARVAGAPEGRIITAHLLPSVMSYLVVNATLAIPNMILGETALSFLGLGLRPPAVSWGVLLKVAQNVRTVAFHPWLLLPGFFVLVVILAFNFVGDGLRDAADPYR
jgi:peptide/nickel transport system permease protein